MKFFNLLIVASMVFATQANASSKKKKASASAKGAFSQTGEAGPYGMAGCGLGAVLFGDQPGKIQILAATSNGIVSGNQTFGMTTGTLGCGDRNKFVKAQQFIEVNKVAVENDLARGGGETLSALSFVMQCQNADFSDRLKSNYKYGATVDELSVSAADACKI